MARSAVLRDFVRRNGRLIGGIVSLLALAAFVHAFGKLLTLHDATIMVRDHWSALLAALALYGVAYVPMCVAWQTLARGVGARIAPLALVQVFLVSQIGKYLPGNVGHLLGRAYLARSRGVPLDVSGIAMSLELAGVLAAGALFAALAGALSPGSGGYSLVAPAAAILALIMASAVLVLARKRTPRLRTLAGPMAAAVAYYLAVFTLLAAANATLLGATSWPLALHVATAVVLSWLIGFMVPGAPAGLGLREMSLYALLAGAFPAPTVLLAAVGMRLVTTTGDGLAWLAGIGLRHLGAPAEPSPVRG